MKPDKLDLAAMIIVCICLLGVAAAAWVMDPARQPTRVAFLHPATGGTQNVWMADIDDPAAQQQLTFSEHGVFDFDFSADGRWLAFAERSGAGAVTLRLLDLTDAAPDQSWSIALRSKRIARRRSSVLMANGWSINGRNRLAGATGCRASG